MVGLVSEVGADPATWMSIQPVGGGPSLRLSGAGATTLRGISGAEVWVTGAREADGFRVDAFEVRRANGVAVDDGVVSIDQGKVFIRMRSGTVREVPDPPVALRGMSGARIWITRPVVNQSPSYGVIQRP